MNAKFSFAFFKQLRRGLALACLLTFVACGNDDSEKSSGGTSEYTALWNDVFSVRCGSCHGVAAIGTQGGPDMRTKDAFYDGMFNKKGSDYPNWDTFQNNRENCNPVAFISPGKPSESMLVAIFDSSVTPCTVINHKEPDQSIPLTSAQLTSLKTWITNGATR